MVPVGGVNVDGDVVTVRAMSLLTPSTAVMTVDADRFCVFGTPWLAVLSVACVEVVSPVTVSGYVLL